MLRRRGSAPDWSSAQDTDPLVASSKPMTLTSGSFNLTSPWLPQSTARVARFEVATGVGLAPVSPTNPSTW
jgi:hypothetical protein